MTLEKDYINISKLDAAKRQLEIAIRLFLSSSDIVAIHTLTGASHTLLRDLGKQQGKESLVKDEFIKKIKPEYQARFKNWVNEAENFFKHADKDPNKLLKFTLSQTEMLLWDTCSMYKAITKEDTPLIKIFNMWFFAKNPELLGDEKVRLNVINLISKLSLDYKNKGQFLDLLPEASKIKNF